MYMGMSWFRDKKQYERLCLLLLRSNIFKFLPRHFLLSIIDVTDFQASGEHLITS